MRTKPKQPPTPFGVSLRKLRRQKQFTLRQLAEMIGVPHQTIDAIEMGRSQDPGAELAAKLAAALTAKTELTKKGLILESVYPVS